MERWEAGANLRVAAASTDAAAIERARLHLYRASPRRSARRAFYWTQIFAFCSLSGALYWGLHTAPGATLLLLHAAAIALFSTVIAWRLAAAANLSPLLSRLSDPEDWPIYTVLCPLYREAHVVADLVAALEHIEYPKDALDIKLIVEGDDVETLTAALAVSGAPHIDVVIVSPTAPRTKPKALNVGLERARGDYLAVFDAEDRPHPQQLQAALAAFEDGPDTLACVQAPLVIDNGEAAWIARQFAAEYEIQFREILPFLARAGLPLPLGGSSNHFRVDMLRAIGGWDPYNVTEDADLGYRFAREGLTTGVIAPPTWEEGPVTLKAWRRQRARWIKGHMQTWLVLMRDPFGAMREMGAANFAAMQLTLLGGILAAFAHAPLAILVLTAMFTSYNLTPVDFALAISGYGVGFFAALSAAALSGNTTHIRTALTMPFYWPLLTIPALQALVELIFRPHAWAKTTHGVSPRRKISAPASAARAEAHTPHQPRARSGSRR